MISKHAAKQTNVLYRLAFNVLLGCMNVLTSKHWPQYKIMLNNCKLLLYELSWDSILLQNTFPAEHIKIFS